MDRERKIIWAPRALGDLANIFEFIQQDKPLAAKEFVNQFIHAVEKLARHPNLGRFIPEIGKIRYRELIHGEYRIFHEIREKDILIFRILHSKRLF